MQEHRERDGDSNRNDRIYHPSNPSNCFRPLAPQGYANKHPHFHKGCEAHRHGAEELRVDRILNHDAPNLWVEAVAKEGYDQSKGEENNIEDEKDNGEIVQHRGFERDEPDKDGHDAGPHCY